MRRARLRVCLVITRVIAYLSFIVTSLSVRRSLASMDIAPPLHHSRAPRLDAGTGYRSLDVTFDSTRPHGPTRNCHPAIPMDADVQHPWVGIV